MLESLTKWITVFVNCLDAPSLNIQIDAGNHWQALDKRNACHRCYLSFSMNYILHCGSWGDFSTSLLQKQRYIQQQILGGHVSSCHYELTDKLVAASWVHLSVTETPSASKYSLIAPSCDAFTHLNAKFYRLPEDVGPGLVAADLDSQREDQKGDGQRRPDIYY